MPIKGIADRAEGGFAQIGVIRKGGKKVRKYSEKAHREVEMVGPDLHYFRVEFDERDTETAQEFERVFGKEPTDIMIFLPFPEPERCWEYWIEMYTAGSLAHQCDGEYVHYAINPATGEKLVTNWIGKAGEREKCPGHPKGDGAKPTGRLRVIVPALKRIAYLVVKTTSWYDCQNITDQLEGFKRINKGSVAGIPIILKRRPAMIPTPGENGKKIRREKWLISLEVDPIWAAAKFEEAKRLAMPASDAQATEKLTEPKQALSAGPAGIPCAFEDEDPDAEEMAGEFELLGTDDAEPIVEAPATLSESAAAVASPIPDQPAAKTVAPDIALIITQVQNQGGRLYLEDGHLKLNGKEITPTLKEKVKANARVIAEALSEESIPF